MPIGCTLTAHRKRVPIGSLSAFWHVPSAQETLLGLGCLLYNYCTPYRSISSFCIALRKCRSRLLMEPSAGGLFLFSFQRTSDILDQLHLCAGTRHLQQCPLRNKRSQVIYVPCGVFLFRPVPAASAVPKPLYEIGNLRGVDHFCLCTLFDLLL